MPIDARISPLPPKLAEAYARNTGQEWPTTPLPAVPQPAPEKNAGPDYVYSTTASAKPRPLTADEDLLSRDPGPLRPPTGEKRVRPMTADEDLYGHKTIEDIRNEDPSQYQGIYDGS